MPEPLLHDMAYGHNEITQRLGIGHRQPTAATLTERPPMERSERAAQLVDLDQAVGQWLDLKEERHKLDGRISDLEAVLLANIRPGGRHLVGGMEGVGVRVQGPSRRLNADTAREVLGAERYLLACETMPTAAGVRKVAAGWELDQIITPAPGAKPTVRAL